MKLLKYSFVGTMKIDDMQAVFGPSYTVLTVVYDPKRRGKIPKKHRAASSGRLFW